MTRVLLLSILAIFIGAQSVFANSQDTLSVSTQKLNEQQKLKNQKQDPKVNMRFDMRFDGVYENFGKEDIEGRAGFVGQYAKLIVDGRISDKFEYSFRYRLYTRPNAPTQFFQNIDWANITWNISDKFFLTAGKQIVAVGGYEYDAAPIDVYFASNFWNNVNPYQIGISGGYTSENKKHTMKLQFVNSPFSTKAFETMFSYNFIWYGDFGWFKPIYSFNLMEFERGKFINYVSLGNRFIAGDATFDFDFMNRAGSIDRATQDFSVLLKVNYDISDKFSVFVKGGYDQNKAQDPSTIAAGTSYNRLVKPGTAFGFYGVGAEYFPVKTARHNVRVHAFWFSNTDKVTATNPLHTFDIGVKWEMTILHR